MVKNYFVTAWRNIGKDKGYTAFNILGWQAVRHICSAGYFYIMPGVIRAGCVCSTTADNGNRYTQGAWGICAAIVDVTIKRIYGTCAYK